MDPRNDPRNDLKPDADKYTRESFTWRPMKKWQIWSLLGVLAALVVVVIVAP